MLNSQTAINYVRRIESIRKNAEDGEAEILANFRAEPDYEPNQDKDLLEAVRLRAEARKLLDEADTLIRSYDFVWSEEAGEVVPKAAA